VTDILLVGTQNRGKAVELVALLDGLPWDVRNLLDFAPVPAPVEDGTTFEANAIKKAVYFSKHFGMACLADDSGLVVDALDGEPGVYSARYAGEDGNATANTAKLLANLKDVPAPERTARFVCCAAFVRAGFEPHTEFGAVEGAIAFAPRGSGGFGYDPVFVPAGYDETFGEMDSKIKMTISHRARALRKIREYLQSLREGTFGASGV
jgi:XTP/dITP diphosphohydrolase